MAGNTFGKIFRVTTWGESHGPALGAVIDGCPPRLLLAAADIDEALARRRPGVQTHATSRREPDRVEILSGVFEACTTGMPASLHAPPESCASIERFMPAIRRLAT